MRYGRKGFQLVELAVVLTIVGVLILFSYSSVSTILLKNEIRDFKNKLDLSKNVLLNYIEANGRIPSDITPVLLGSGLFSRDPETIKSFRILNFRRDINIYTLTGAQLCAALMEFDKFPSSQYYFYNKLEYASFAAKISYGNGRNLYEIPIFIQDLTKILRCNSGRVTAESVNSVFLTQSLPPITIPNSYFFRLISNSRSYNQTNYAANIRIAPPDNNPDDIALCITQAVFVQRFGVPNNGLRSFINNPPGVVATGDLSYRVTADRPNVSADLGFNNLLCPSNPDNNLNNAINSLFSGNKALPNYGLSKNSNFKLYTLYTRNTNDREERNFIGYPYKFIPFVDRNREGAASFNFEIEIVAISKSRNAIVDRKTYILPIATASQYEQGVYITQ